MKEPSILRYIRESDPIRGRVLKVDTDEAVLLSATDKQPAVFIGGTADVLSADPGCIVWLYQTRKGRFFIVNTSVNQDEPIKIMFVEKTYARHIYTKHLEISENCIRQPFPEEPPKVINFEMKDGTDTDADTEHGKEMGGEAA